ncbi:MAG: class I SAM-dependent methyltransferase [Acidobacteriia bacterium]|nr:class I SAM-dependent methyltransferase [Terriglobia bacterium]
MSENACPLCSTEETEFFARCTDHLLKTTDKMFSLRECRACGIIYLAPIPSAEELRAYYPSGYWWSESSRARNFLSAVGKRLESLYRRMALRDHIRFVLGAARHVSEEGETVDLLDVGCSGGTLLHELSHRGISGRGLDFSEEAVAHATRVYQLDCSVGDLTQNPWQQHRFSLLTCFHVLEHVPEPRAFLKAMAAALVERGRIVLQVPNIRSWQCRLFGSQWYGLDPPRHLVNFSDRALIRLLQEAGFDVIRKKRFSLRDDAAGWVSSAFPRLDPLARAVRKTSKERPAGEPAALGIFKNFVYFVLLLAATPVALCDSLAGRGATIMLEARRSSKPTTPHN